MQKRTICNICKHSSFKTIYIFKDYSVIECQNCHTLCRDIVLEINESKQLYTKEYFCNLQKDYFFNHKELREKIFNDAIKLINNFSPQKGKLLELGCAIGTFLKIAERHGYEAEGVELSEYAADYAIRNEKLKVHNCDLLDAKFISNSFDVIVMGDVIDHCETPNEIMQESHRILKPNGIVVMYTVMDDSLLFKFANYIYKLTFGIIKKFCQKAHPVNHSHYFSIKTFRHLIELNKFEVIFQKGVNLGGKMLNLDFGEKKIIGLFNFCSNFIGKKTEMLMIGRKN